MCPSGSKSNTNLEVSAAMVSSDYNFRPAFDFLDVDRDGKISPGDLQSFYTSFTSSSSSSSSSSSGAANVGCEQDMISSMISAADSNKDGLVEYEDFEKILFQKPFQTQPPRWDNWLMQDMFRVMDGDGDGKLGFHDLKTYMNYAGLQASDQDIRAMIRFGGGDDCDGISFERLVKVLAFDLAGK